MLTNINQGVSILIMIVFAVLLIAIKQNDIQSAASAPIRIGPNTANRIKSILESNPWWKDLLKDPRPV